jgi:hypothetical protein
MVACEIDMHSSKNYQLYRRYFKQGVESRLPQIPHLAVLLKDIYQL